MISATIIEEVKNRLIKTYDPLEIYIFGSYAWGAPTDDSDLDVLIVVDRYKKNPHYTIAEGYGALVGLGIAKDLLVVTKNEFDEFAKDPIDFFNEIKAKGIRIYAKA